MSDFSRNEISTLVFLFGSYRLEPDGVLHRQDQQIHLPPKELEALRFLLQNPGRIVTPSELKRSLWGQVHVTADSVPRCISSLRAALLPDELIQTVYKKGYRFIAPVECTDSQIAARPRRIVILPFAAMEDVPTYLGPVIAEEMITRLSDDSITRLTSVSVLARDSIFALAQQGLTAQEVGKAMSADLALTGNLRALPAHFRLRIEAIRVEDAAQIWVEDFLVNRSRAEGLESGMIDRILSRIAGASPQLIAVAESLQAGPRNAFQREAYEAYQRGHHATYEPLQGSLQDGLQHLLRATELDPTLISAQIDLINTLITRTYCGFMSPAIAAEQARRAARILPIHSTGNGTILPTLGWIRFHLDHNLHGALRAFRESSGSQHDPWTSRARIMVALSRHRFDEAVALIESAIRVDPYAPWQHARLAWTWHLAGDLGNSLRQTERALALFPNHEGVYFYASQILAYAGETDRALHLTRDLIRRFPNFDLGTALHGYALACAGRETEASALVEQLQWLSRERYVSSSFNSAICVKLGRLEDAIGELRAAEEARCPWFFQMLADPRLHELHGLPEFIRMQGILDTMESTIAHAPNQPSS
ncbi:MAG TPA: winged helix-turn-helix domain-containing protein [Terracidiphilus sp.]|jgi:DNA-binding winged helix-turn-helix (wHTH) protein/tetratricopeptide (TPR) repeat protein|nr:winged helix-turn-helix domain-containing protein [Terracidiphilus sp.]